MKRRTRSSTNSACARTWEIEPARDGRLSDAAIVTLGRHVEQCPVCRQEVDYLEGLSRALGELGAPKVDDIALRRLRQRVLQRADAELAGRSIAPVRRRRALVTIARIAPVAPITLAMAVVMLLFWSRWRSEVVSSPPPVVATTTVDATAAGDARWTKRTEGETERVDLSDGTLRLRVRKAPNGRKVVVHVPDGEIEDLGTTFQVVVRDGATQRVAVEEGRVTIRLTNAAPVTIASGDTWERAAPSAPMPVAPAGVRSSTSSAPPLPPASAAHERPAAAPVGVSSAFAIPAHGDEEDAAYLRAVRLVREGRGSEARAAARDYLRRFPDGFRREEMGRIAK